MNETILSLLAREPASIAYLGNSVTGQRGGYREVLHRLLQQHSGQSHRAINAGFGGVGSLASVCTMDQMVIGHDPRLCFIECFTGDIGVGHHALTGAAIEGIVAKLNAIGAIAAVLLLPRKGMGKPEAIDLAELYLAIARHHALPVIDLRHRWPDLDPLLRDGVHTNEAGSQAFAEAILAALERPLPTFRPTDALFAPDLSSARQISLAELLPARPHDALFRLQQPYWIFRAGETFRAVLPDNALLGLLVIQGPEAGTISINGETRSLPDRWSHFQRLHAHLLVEPIAAGEPITVAIETGELHLCALLTYRP